MVEQATIDPNLIQAYAREAARDGLTQDQFENFVRGAYVAQHKQRLFHAYARLADKPNGPRYVGLGGARGPGKSHASMAQVFLDDCFRQPNLKVLFLRKIQKSAAESLEDLVYRILRSVPHNYIPSKGEINFPNGSRVKLGGYRAAKDIEQYIGIEYDIIVIEECTMLDEERFLKIDGSLRTSLPQWRPRMYLTTNPGNIGHRWFFEMFVKPAREGNETITRFVECNYRDNAFIGQDYIDYLERLGNTTLGLMWREGDWSHFTGKAFPNYRDTYVKDGGHIIVPFQIPHNFPMWEGTDSGYGAPFCNLRFAMQPETGRVFVTDEIYQAGLTDIHQAVMIRESRDPNYIIRLNYGDPAMFHSKRSVQVVLDENDIRFKSSAQVYGEHGVPLVRADNNRILGKRKVERYLENLPDGLPGLIIFDRCINLRRQLDTLVLDEKNPDDIAPRQEDHAYDGLRYGLTRADFPEFSEFEIKKRAHERRMREIWDIPDDQLPRPLQNAKRSILDTDLF